VRVHGADLGSLRRRIEQSIVASRAVIAAIGGRAAAPTATASDLSRILNHEIAAIHDQSAVEAHEDMAGAYLVGGEKIILQTINGQCHNSVQSGFVGGKSEAMGQG